MVNIAVFIGRCCARLGSNKSIWRSKLEVVFTLLQIVDVVDAVFIGCGFSYHFIVGIEGFYLHAPQSFFFTVLLAILVFIQPNQIAHLTHRIISCSKLGAILAFTYVKYRGSSFTVAMIYVAVYFFVVANIGPCIDQTIRRHYYLDVIIARRHTERKITIARW